MEWPGPEALAGRPSCCKALRLIGNAGWGWGLGSPGCFLYGLESRRTQPFLGSVFYMESKFWGLGKPLWEKAVRAGIRLWLVRPAGQEDVRTLPTSCDRVGLRRLEEAMGGELAGASALGPPS